MKKLLVSILLTLVVGIGAFAKPFIAFTDKESFETYRSNINNINALNDCALKSFENGTTDIPKKEWKYYTYILVVDKSGVTNHIWVFTKDLKSFGICTSYEDEQVDRDYHCDTLQKTDPVQVGLNFIEQKVLTIISLDPFECIYSAYELEGDN